MSAAGAAVRIEALRFAWPGGRVVLDIPAFEIGCGERVLLRGPSGSGKSTLLGLIGGVLKPTSGRVEVLGRNLGSLPAAARDRFRGEHLGFIFQMFNLLPFLSVIDNVLLPCRFNPGRAHRAGDSEQRRRAEAERLLAALGLEREAWAGRPVRELSVGQQQRVAAARALIGQPELVLADEPTSALDAQHRDRFLELLGRECARSGAALLFVSHDPALAPHFERVLELAQLNRAALA